VSWAHFRGRYAAFPLALFPLLWGCADFEPKVRALNLCTDGDASSVKAAELEPSASKVAAEGGCQGLDEGDDDGGY
jgi:hypothetical protein